MGPTLGCQQKAVSDCQGQATDRCHSQPTDCTRSKTVNTPAPAPPSSCRPTAVLLAVTALLACASGALAAGQHLPLPEGCCPDHAKTLSQLQTQLRTLQNQFNLLQRTVQPLLNVKTQLVQV